MSNLKNFEKIITNSVIKELRWCQIEKQF
jgi:hypothetical protein